VEFNNMDYMIRFPSFGRKSLRISNAITSACFHDQTFSAPVVDEAGEKDAYPDVQSGARQPFFVFEFDFASTLPQLHQPGLAVNLSADNGDGARMSQVEMADAADGLRVIFIDYQDRPPYGSEENPANGAGPGGDDFYETIVASGLDRTAKHHVRVEHSFYDGPHNDVVIVNVDEGKFVHHGTSWEDFYRWRQPVIDPSQTKLVRESRVARSIMFHTRTTRGTAPNTLRFGFKFDNVDQASGPILVGPPSDKDECKKGGFRTFNNPSFRNEGECVSFVEDHDRDHGHGRGDRDDRNDRDHDRDNDHRDDDHRDNHDRDGRRDRRP
jgi:hypothetical protein